jgi:hypothetical protein
MTSATSPIFSSYAANPPYSYPQGNDNHSNHNVPAKQHYVQPQTHYPPAHAHQYIQSSQPAVLALSNKRSRYDPPSLSNVVAAKAVVFHPQGQQQQQSPHYNRPQMAYPKPSVATVVRHGNPSFPYAAALPVNPRSTMKSPLPAPPQPQPEAHVKQSTDVIMAKVIQNQLIANQQAAVAAAARAAQSANMNNSHNSAGYQRNHGSPYHAGFNQTTANISQPMAASQSLMLQRAISAPFQHSNPTLLHTPQPPQYHHPSLSVSPPRHLNLHGLHPDNKDHLFDMYSDNYNAPRSSHSTVIHPGTTSTTSVISTEDDFDWSILDSSHPSAEKLHPGNSVATANFLSVSSTPNIVSTTILNPNKRRLSLISIPEGSNFNLEDSWDSVINFSANPGASVVNSTVSSRRNSIDFSNSFLADNINSIAFNTNIL